MFHLLSVRIRVCIGLQKHWHLNETVFLLMLYWAVRVYLIGETEVNTTPAKNWRFKDSVHDCLCDSKPTLLLTKLFKNHIELFFTLVFPINAILTTEVILMYVYAFLCKCRGGLRFWHVYVSSYLTTRFFTETNTKCPSEGMTRFDLNSTVAL